MLKEIISTVTYEIDSRAASALRPGQARELRVDSGVVWATLSGDDADHWLSPGATLPIARDQIVWLSAERGSSARVVLIHTPRTAALALLLRLPISVWRRLRLQLKSTRQRCDTCHAS